jgi:hypothetical protein
MPAHFSSSQSHEKHSHTNLITSLQSSPFLYSILVSSTASKPTNQIVFEAHFQSSRILSRGKDGTATVKSYRLEVELWCGDADPHAFSCIIGQACARGDSSSIRQPWCIVNCVLLILECTTHLDHRQDQVRSLSVTSGSACRCRISKHHQVCHHARLGQRTRYRRVSKNKMRRRPAMPSVLVSDITCQGTFG